MIIIKLLFLDFDGVINKNCFQDNWTNLSLPFHSETKGKMYMDFHTDCIGWFENILYECQERKISIVISSTWRMLFNIEEFNVAFKNLFPRIKKDLVIGVTARTCQDRGLEILSFMKNKLIEDYLVLDDMSKGIKEYIIEDNFIWIDNETGLNEKYFKKILDKLNKM